MPISCHQCWLPGCVHLCVVCVCVSGEENIGLAMFISWNALGKPQEGDTEFDSSFLPSPSWRVELALSLSLNHSALSPLLVKTYYCSNQGWD